LEIERRNDSYLLSLLRKEEKTNVTYFFCIPSASTTNLKMSSFKKTKKSVQFITIMNLITLIGAFGLLLISTGILTKVRKKQNLLFIFGGLCLEVYSIFLWDYVFMILQLVFISAALYDFVYR